MNSPQSVKFFCPYVFFSVEIRGDIYPEQIRITCAPNCLNLANYNHHTNKIITSAKMIVNRDNVTGLAELQACANVEAGTIPKRTSIGRNMM